MIERFWGLHPFGLWAERRVFLTLVGILAAGLAACGGAASGSPPGPGSSDTTAPVVSVTSPTAGQTVAGATAVTASATDNVSVAGVQFRLDGASLGAEDTTVPYSVSWDTTATTDGSHTVTAVARDAAGNTAVSGGVAVTVDNSSSDSTPPTVSITAPTSGSTVSGSITVSANASDNVAVAGVQFKRDSVNIGGEDTSAPYSVSLDTTTLTNGSHTLTAVARDTSNNATVSAGVTVTVDNAIGGTASLTCSTYLGGSRFDRVQGVTVDSAGFIYAVGNTVSSDFPTTSGVFDPTYNGGNQDAFVAKLTPDCSSVVWATYLGTSGEDRGYRAQVDAAGFVYVVGITKASGFPTTSGAYDRTFNGGNGDIFVTKLTPDGSSLVYSTYIGGASEDWCRGTMYLDSAGNIYLSGRTSSANFPTTPGAFQSVHQGNWDGYLLKLSADGSTLIFSTLIGGSGWDAAYSGVEVHSDGSIYVAGMTNSQNFPITSGVFQTSYGGDTGGSFFGDGFIARFSADGSSLIYSTFLGGSADDGVTGNHGLAIDAAGQAIVLSSTGSVDFPVTSGVFQGSYGGGNRDGVVTILSTTGSSLVSSTYLGGSGPDVTAGIAVDASGNIFLSGNTGSSGYPLTPDAAQSTYGGGNTDALLTIFPTDLSTLVYSTFLGSSSLDRGRDLVLDSSGNIIIGGDTTGTDFPVTANAFQQSSQGNGDGFVAKFNFTPTP